MEERSLAGLYAGIARVRAAQECRNLMGHYLIGMMGSKMWQYLDRWVGREDASLEMPWGRYDGKSGVVYCYLVDHGDYTDPTIPDNAGAGVLAIHLSSSECVEVAADGKTARGIFHTGGTETIRKDGCCCFTRYGVDFIRDERGAWKIWHMWLVPNGMNQFPYCWTDSEHTSWTTVSWQPKDDELFHKAWRYSPDDVYPLCWPDYPHKYASWDEVAPGYGYDILRFKKMESGEAEEHE